MDKVTLNLRLTPTELTLLAAVINDKIAWFDEEYARIRRLAEEADAIFMFDRDMDTNRIMRAVYVSMVRRIEQALDVPFIDQEEALEAVRA